MTARVIALYSLLSAGIAPELPAVGRAGGGGEAETSARTGSSVGGACSRHNLRGELLPMSDALSGKCTLVYVPYVHSSEDSVMKRRTHTEAGRPDIPGRGCRHRPLREMLGQQT